MKNEHKHVFLSDKWCMKVFKVECLKKELQEFKILGLLYSNCHDIKEMKDNKFIFEL